ncbi:MAG: PorV/PorQ family protein [Calditrichaceae bacterium]|nr:PorV/PorQ family protein [Calditrichaceae bacterium]MBN2708935.1 PorV/PorQ family protein [Calditrichaceae bacterium]
MNKIKFVIILLGACVILSNGILYAQEIKLAQTGFQFLSVSSDARASGMAEAVNSREIASSSMFFNPACMATLPNMVETSFSLNSFIADIKYVAFSLAYRPSLGQYGVIGLSLQSVDYGDLDHTMIFPNTQGFVDMGTFNPSALAIGIGYAKSLSDKFSVGGNVKYVYQYLGTSVIEEGVNTLKKKNIADVIAFDFGTLFDTGFKGIKFGMSVRNFAREIKYENENFQLPLLFTLGVSTDLNNLIELDKEMHSLIASVDLTHPRAHAEQLKIGFDYTLMNMLSLRTGYTLNNDEDGLTFGVGVSKFGIEFDYAYAPFGIFDNVQRITGRIAIK